MNICFVENGYPRKTYAGGAGVYVQTIAKELARLGQKSFVITKSLDNKTRRFNDQEVIVQEVRIKGLFSWYLSKLPLFGKILARFFYILAEARAVNKQILNINREYGLDVVEFAETPNFLYTLGGNIPYIVHLHGSSFTFKKYCGEKIFLADKLQRFLEGMVIRKAKAIISPSEFLKKEIVSEFKLSPGGIKKIPYPVDERLFFLKRGAKKEAKIIFYSGRLERRKGIHVLKEAIPLVLKKEPKTKFLFFGSTESKELKEDLDTYFISKGVNKEVTLYPFAEREELFNFLATADICVIPSLWDNSPNVVYEAMAAGKTVLAAATGGIVELIEDGVTGALFLPNDVKSLADKLVDLLNDDKKRNRLANCAKDFARRKFAVTGITKEHLKIYEEALIPK